ncbi:zinc finger MYND domain-containing protein 12 isoform X2 [Melopsittacus undulatus]|uniref:zinc finger MYND domain-containing protein 12 isoform X2 n=1 Tax=Melopsittacus undulatus TaxID=13146 RepID=UPI00146F0CBD|nr:zinc finger MYND domain-containing protein 12 isoform X2 [Melopsittacus undulatus]
MEQLLRRQKHIIDVAYSTAQELVWAGKHEEARPAALHALRFSIEVYGPDSLQLVPAYLLLAEASAGAGHLPEASKYLSQAEWLILRAPDCSAAVQYKLHRSLGLFCAAKGDLERALYHLANDVTSTWHSFLLKSLRAQQQVLKSRPETSLFTEDRAPREEPMTEAQQVEGIRVLSAILDIREQAPTQQPGETARVLHALAMLHYLLMDIPKAQELGLKAFELVKQLPQQELLEPLGHLLKLMNVEPSSPE